jgi:hypothetical protein
MSWSLQLSCRVLAAVGLLGVGALVPAALAQQGPQEFSTFRIFEGDSVVLNPGAVQRLAEAIRRAQTPGDCPVGRLKVRAAEGDPLFQQAVSFARRDAILAALDRLGIPVAGRLVVETSVFGGPEGDDTIYENWGDRTPPSLRTTSDPPKGSKVQPGQRIVVRMAARDDTDRWQTGIKTIHLVAESEGGRDLPPTPVRYEPCSDPREKRVEATYVVPSDPPPVVRLKATATDHANLTDFDIGEFPTGDFYGTFTYDLVGPGQPFHAQADIVLKHDGKGNLTGTMVGQQRASPFAVGACTSSSVQPGRFRVSLVGSFTERSSPSEGHTLKVFVGDAIEDTPHIEEWRCSGRVQRVERPFKLSVWPQQAFLGTPSFLGDGEVLPDGTRRYKFESFPSTWAVTLRRARN